MLEGVITPWRMTEDLLLVRQQLFGLQHHEARIEDNFIPRDERRLAVNRITTWAIDGSCDHYIESTAELMRCILAYEKATEETDFEQLRMSFCAAFTRLITGLADISRKSQNITMQESASRIGMPISWVDIRHDCVHKSKPSLELLQAESLAVIEWLWHNYWRKLNFANGHHNLRTLCGDPDNGLKPLLSIAKPDMTEQELKDEILHLSNSSEQYATRWLILEAYVEKHGYTPIIRAIDMCVGDAASRKLTSKADVTSRLRSFGKDALERMLDNKRKREEEVGQNQASKKPKTTSLDNILADLRRFKAAMDEWSTSGPAASEPGPSHGTRKFPVVSGPSTSTGISSQSQLATASQTQLQLQTPQAEAAPSSIVSARRSIQLPATDCVNESVQGNKPVWPIGTLYARWAAARRSAELQAAAAMQQATFTKP